MNWETVTAGCDDKRDRNLARAACPATQALTSFGFYGTGPHQYLRFCSLPARCVRPMARRPFRLLAAALARIEVTA